MNLRDLHYLVALATHKHFGKAAQESHVSQPTLSMQIKKLEEYLGIQLVERNHKHVMITPIGEEIAARARLIIDDINNIKTIAKAAQDPFAGNFRLGAFPTLAPYLLPQIVPIIHQALPELRLLLTEEKTDTLLEQLKTGVVDAALLALPIIDERLTAIPLFDDPFVLAVPEQHPLASRNQISLSNVINEKLLLLEEGHCLRNQALNVCHLIGTSEYQDFRATSLETLRQMVVANVGITLIPQLAVRPTQGIVYIPFKSPAPLRTIGIVFRKSSVKKTCIEFLTQLIIKTEIQTR